MTQKSATDLSADISFRVSAYLHPEVQINGNWLSLESAAIHYSLTEAVGADSGAITRRLCFENRSDKTIKLGGFRWSRQVNQQDFLATPGANLRVYLEGWCMPSPCGSVRLGDSDFSFNPEYMPLAVCNPASYNNSEPNRFRAENLIAINVTNSSATQKDAVSGQTLVIGFVTTASQFGRFTLQLSEQGVAELYAYSDTDGREVDPGETVESETLALLSGDNGEAVLGSFASLWGKLMQARTDKSVPVGWCSWYHYFSRVTEQDIKENVDFIAKNREMYPLQYIQLDDGYESALGDWLTVNEKFPSGLSALAKYIRDQGFIPAIWFGPFMVGNDSVLFKEHPDWLLRDSNGQVKFAMSWRNGVQVAALDGSHPEVQEHFRQLFRTIRQMGFDYIKLDFMMLACAPDTVRHDRKCTRAEAFRRGLTAIREGFGDDGFILACTSPLSPTIGLVDGERIATDITPYWKPDRKFFDEAPTVPNVCRNMINRAYMHRRLWLNDPDVAIVREEENKLTENEVNLWYNALHLSGGMMFLGDRIEGLSKERAALAHQLLVDADKCDVVPLDRWEQTVPEVWQSTNRVTSEIMTGHFNFSDQESTKNEVNLLPHSSIVIK